MTHTPGSDSRCLHATALYGSDEEFLTTVVPFVRGGVDAAQPVVVAAASAEDDRLLRNAIPADGVTFLEPGYYRRPATVVAGILEFVERHAGPGAGPVRVVGAVPRPDHDGGWEPWLRYEAAANELYAAYPLWALCPYDTRHTPAAVLDDLKRTHPYRLDADGRHEALPDFQGHAAFLEGRELTAPTTQPDVELADPTLAEARRAIAQAGRSAHLDKDKVDELMLAVNETLANAEEHGRGTRRVRLWIRRGAVVATVSDRGKGPASGLAGLVPPDGNPLDGRGLWLVHNLCDEVTMGRSADGFTIRMVVGQPGDSV